MSSNKMMMSVAAVLCGGQLIAGMIYPKFLSIEAIVLSSIAAFLAGIHAELKRANDLRELGK